MNEALPDSKDYTGWIRHIDKKLLENAGINPKWISEDGILEPLQQLKLNRLTFFEADHELRFREKHKLNSVEQLKMEKEKLASHIAEHFAATFKHAYLSSDPDLAETMIEDLRAFGKSIVKGGKSRAYNARILFGNELKLFLKQYERWPEREEMMRLLRLLGTPLETKIITDCVDFFGLKPDGVPLIADSKRGRKPER